MFFYKMFFFIKYHSNLCISFIRFKIIRNWTAFYLFIIYNFNIYRELNIYEALGFTQWTLLLKF